MPQLKKLVLFILLCLPTSVWASFTAATHFAVRTDGSDTNSGAFDPTVSAPGTDYSNQAAGQVSFTDITISSSAHFTSVLNPATTYYPGNGVYITGTTSGSCTVGNYEILSESAGTYTVDRSLGTTSSVCTGILGGAKLTLASALSGATAGNTFYVKSGTYNPSTVTNIALGGVTIVGYGTTFDDWGTKPVFSSTATNGTVFSITVGGNSVTFINISLSGNGTNGPGVYVTSTGTRLYMFSVYASGFGASGTDSGGVIDSENGTNSYFNQIVIDSSEFTSNAQVLSMESGVTGVNYSILNSYIHGNSTTTTGFLDGFLTLRFNVFAGQTGTYDVSGSGNTIFCISNNVFYGDTGTAVYYQTTPSPQCPWRNNIFYGNGRAISGTNTAFSASYSKGNAFGNNTSGNADWPLSSLDITLTANPFVNASGGNFALNTTSGGGLLLTGLGYPSTYGTGTANALNVGAVQGGSGGGGTTVLVQGFAY